MKIATVTSTYKRPEKTYRAVKSNLDQLKSPDVYLVIDDASDDNTQEILTPFFDRPNFIYLKLGKNIGTYQIRNLALGLLGEYDAVSFHDSDDIVRPEKLLAQSRIMENYKAMWPETMNSYMEGMRETIDVVTSASRYVFINGKIEIMGSVGSLYKNVMPNLFYPNKERYSFTNSSHALFRMEIFETLGGYYPVRVSADIEMRDRCMIYGYNFYHFDEPLMDMFSGDDSLTVADDTNLKSELRNQVRQETGARIIEMKKTPDKQEFIDKFYVPIDVDTSIEFLSGNKHLLKINEKLQISEPTKQLIFDILG